MRVNVRDILSGLGFIARLILGKKKLRKIQNILEDVDDAMIMLETFKVLRDKVDEYVVAKSGRPLTLTKIDAQDLHDMLQTIDKLGNKLEDVFKKRR